MIQQDGPISLLVVTPCSATKANPPDPDVFQREFWSTRSTSQSDQWPQRGLVARDLYQGAHHRSVMTSVDNLRAEFCHIRIEVAIVSARYGLVQEWDRLAPYDESFDRMSRQESIDVSHRLGIRSQLAQQLAEFRYAVFLLSETYLNAIEAPMGIAENEIYFAGRAFDSELENVSIVRTGRTEAKSLGVAPRMAKAELLRRITDSALEDGLNEVLERLVSEPTAGVTTQ